MIDARETLPSTLNRAISASRFTGKDRPPVVAQNLEAVARVRGRATLGRGDPRDSQPFAHKGPRASLPLDTTKHAVKLARVAARSPPRGR